MGFDESGDFHDATISGALRDGEEVEITLGEGEWAGVNIESPHINVGGAVYSGDSDPYIDPYQFNAYWITPEETTGRVHALHWEGSGDALFNWVAENYLGYGVSDDVTLAYGAILTDVDVTLESVSTASIAGEVTLPAGFGFVYYRLKVLPSGSAALFPVLDTVSPGAAFDYAIPLIPDGEYALSVFAVSDILADGARAMIVRRGPLAAASGLDFTVPEPHQLLSPGDLDTVDYGDAFSWSAFPDGVYIVTIRASTQFIAGEMAPLSQVIGAPIITIYTSATSTTLPDLTAHGVDLEIGEYYDWPVFALAPFDRLDDFATGPVLGLMTIAQVYEGDYAGSSLSTFQFDSGF